MKRNLVKVRITKRMNPKRRKMMEGILEKEFSRYLDDQFHKALLQISSNACGYEYAAKTLNSLKEPRLRIP